MPARSPGRVWRGAAEQSNPLSQGSATEVVMTEAIWCATYGLLWWWVALVLPDRPR